MHKFILSWLFHCQGSLIHGTALFSCSHQLNLFLFHLRLCSEFRFINISIWLNCDKQRCCIILCTLLWLVGTGAIVAVKKALQRGLPHASTVLAYAALLLGLFSRRARQKRETPPPKACLGFVYFHAKTTRPRIVSFPASTCSPGPCFSPPATPNLDFDHCSCTTPGCCFDIRTRRAPR